MIGKIVRKIEEKMYGKRLYNLDIQTTCNEKTIGIRQNNDFIKKFIFTQKGYLLKGIDKDLESRTAHLNLSDGDNIIRTFIHGQYNQLKRTRIGVRFAA